MGHTRRPEEDARCPGSRRVALIVAAIALAAAPSATAQVPDHLKCYRVEDPQAKSTYVADLGGLAAEAGCQIKVPGKFLCVATEKTNVQPAPPGGGSGQPAGRFLCNKLKGAPFTTSVACSTPCSACMM